ncbi:MAG TPA: lysozyme inhibitor LprI family protein [Bacteroidia bacterium]
MKKSLFILLFSSSFMFVCAQTNIKAKDIALIDKNYQVCLDSGQYMGGCSYTYYNQMDSCLNVAYKQLQKKLDKTAKAALKKEQVDWLKTRDQEFKSIDQTNKMEGRDGEMIRESEKAQVVKKRVLVLITKIESSN